MGRSLPSERAAIVATIDPDDITTNAVVSDWVDMSKFERIMAVAMAGVIAGTIDVKLEQATDSSGTGAKAITNDKIATQLSAAAGDDDQVIINLRTDELDVEGGFTHVAMTIDGGTGGANFAAGLILGFDPKSAPASDNDLASVLEILP